MTKDISIIDYDIGNILSVKRSVEILGFKTHVTKEKDKILNSDKIILPGVGAFKNGMNLLKKHNLIEVIREAAENKKSILGICLGMQLFFDESFEFGQTKGLGLIKGKVEKIIIDDNDKSLKVPSIGWNELIVKKKNKILSGIKNKVSTYFVHSYMVIPEDPAVVLAQCEYEGLMLNAAVGFGNVIGLQFHPERSGPEGLRILERFVRS